MAKYIKQYYYNNPNTITTDVFLGELVYKLSIHALPGLQFKFNKNAVTDPWIVMNGSGTYSMEFDGETPMDLILDETTININNYPIIIDVVFNKKEVIE